MTMVHGIPTLTAERIIADLVARWEDLSLVGNMLRDSVDRGILNHEKLADYLEPLASADGYSSGQEFLSAMQLIAGIPNVASSTDGDIGRHVRESARLLADLDKVSPNDMGALLPTRIRRTSDRARGAHRRAAPNGPRLACRLSTGIGAPGG